MPEMNSPNPRLTRSQAIHAGMSPGQAGLIPIIQQTPCRGTRLSGISSSDRDSANAFGLQEPLVNDLVSSLYLEPVHTLTGR